MPVIAARRVGGQRGNPETSPSWCQKFIGTWKHEMQISLFPNWTRRWEVRLAHIDRDLVRLATDAPMLLGGGRKIAAFMWQRVRAWS